jgi:hypothetical protein
MPDFMADCEVHACRVLHDVSAQIAANCKLFGSQLNGVCSQATERLPKGSRVEDDGFGFLSAFELLSDALVQLAGDLEATVTKPLQSSIAVLTEESVGRVKHWRQIKSQLFDLQEQYGKKKQRTLDAKGKLALANDSSWFNRKPSDAKVAEKQHAAMRDLANCEEELLRCEESLRKIEDESRERLQQLERESQPVLQGVLTKGRSLLRQLIQVAEKAAPPTPQRTPSPEPGDSKEPEPSEAWQDIMQGDRREDSVDIKSQVAQTVSPDTHAAQVVPGDPGKLEAATKTLGDANEPIDPASKYMSSCGSPTGRDFDFHELAELGESGEEVEDGCAASRAMEWTPKTPGSRLSLSTPGQCDRRDSVVSVKRHKLMFQSSDHMLAARQGDRDAAYARTPGSATSATSATSSSSPVALPAVASRPEAPKPQPAPQVSPKLAADIDKADDSDDEDFESAPGNRRPRRRGPVAILNEPEYAFELTPVVTDNPKKSFEEYVRRLPERFACALETSWEALQKRAAEQIAGGHLGKLDFFWVLRPGTRPGADTALGLVCFQFVQGFAANFVRILHLSIIGLDDQGGSGNGESNTQIDRPWRVMLPSVVLEVRRLIFGTLPVGSIRAIVLASTDEDGAVCVDRDVEHAYERCRFRWFQLTQCVKRTRASLIKRETVKLKSRFLVMHAMRAPDDPPAPTTHDVSVRPAILMKSEGTADIGEDGVVAFNRDEVVSTGAPANEGFGGFSSF